MNSVSTFSSASDGHDRILSLWSVTPGVGWAVDVQTVARACHVADALQTPIRPTGDTQLAALELQLWSSRASGGRQLDDVATSTASCAEIAWAVASAASGRLAVPRQRMASVEGLLNATYLGCAHAHLLCRLLQRQVLHALDLGNRYDLGVPQSKGTRSRAARRRAKAVLMCTDPVSRDHSPSGRRRSPGTAPFASSPGGRS